MSEPGEAGPRRRGLFEPVVFTIVAVIVLAALGTWQLERKTWKDKLIETVTQRFAAPPAPWPRTRTSSDRKSTRLNSSHRL